MARLSLLYVLLFLALGCRSNPTCERQIGLMRAELLDLEDRYAILEAKYHDAIGGVPMSPGTITLPPGTEVFPSEYSPADGAREARRDQSSDPNDQIQYDIDDLMMQNAPDGNKPRRERFRNRQRPIHHSATFQPPRNLESAVNTATDNVQQAGYERSVLNRDSAEPDASLIPTTDPTEGSVVDLQVEFAPLYADGAEFPDGIELFVLPVDALGYPVDTTATLAVSLIDPQERNPADQRIGTWQFSDRALAAQTIAGTDALPAGTVRLPLAWNYHAPRHSELELFLRYEPAGQPKIEVQVPLDLELGEATIHPSAVDAALESLSAETGAATDVRPLPGWSPNR